MKRLVPARPNIHTGTGTGTGTGNTYSSNLVAWRWGESWEAVQAALDLSAEHTLAIHYGTFDLAEEPLDDPPKRFDAAAKERLPKDSGWIMHVGETRDF